MIFTNVTQEIQDCMKWEKQNVVIRCIIKDIFSNTHRMNIINYDGDDIHQKEEEHIKTNVTQKKNNNIMKDILIGRDYWNVDLHPGQCISIPLANVCMTADPGHDDDSGNKKMLIIVNKICNGQTGEDLLLLPKKHIEEEKKRSNDLAYLDVYVNKEYMVLFPSEHRKQKYQVLKKLQNKKDDDNLIFYNNDKKEKNNNDRNDLYNIPLQMQKYPNVNQTINSHQQEQQPPLKKKKIIQYGLF